MSKNSTIPKPSKELIAATRLYFEALAAAENLKPIVEKIQVDLLDKLQINYDPKYAEQDRALTGRITDPRHCYLMSDADAARYYPALDAAYQNAGFDNLDGRCPYLMAQSAQMRAENALLDAAVSFHGFAELQADNLYGQIRTDTLDATLCYLAQFVAVRKEAA